MHSPAASLVDLAEVDAMSTTSHATSAFIDVRNHESAFIIQRRFRDFMAGKRPQEPAWLSDAHEQVSGKPPTQTSGRTPTATDKTKKLTRRLPVILIALVILGATVWHGTLIWRRPSAPPPPTHRDPVARAFDGFLRGGAAGAAAGGGIGLFFPMAMPIEIAFGGLVGGVLGAVEGFHSES